MTVAPVSSLDRALAALLDDWNADDPPPRRETVEHVLTSGYAEALDLEAERLNVERAMRAALGGIHPIDAEHLDELRSALRRIDSRLTALRRRLSDLDARFGGSWQHAGDKPGRFEAWPAVS